MNDKIVDVFFPVFGWKRSIGIVAKAVIVGNTLITTWLYGSLCIFLYLILFYNTINYKNLTFYYQGSELVKNTIETKLKKIHYNFLKTDYLNSPIPSTKIFFIKDYWFISWLLGPIFFIESARGDKVTEALTPVFANVTFIHKTSNLYIDSSYLAHELVHILQHDKYGYFTTRINTPTWVAEGYATYRQAQFEGVPINDVYVSDSYKLYATLVKHAITFNKKTLDELHLGKVDYGATLKSLCAIKKDYWGCKGNSSSSDNKDNNS